MRKVFVFMMVTLDGFFEGPDQDINWHNVDEAFNEFAIQQPGRDLAIFGSSNLAVSLLQMGLIDELRIMVNPVVLGSGKSLFNGIHDKLNLKLLKTRTFRSGNVLHYYRPITLEAKRNV